MKPLIKNGKMKRLPGAKSSIYELSARQCRSWYKSCVKANYPEWVTPMMKEFDNAIAGETEGLDGIRMQLSSLLAYWFWWY